MPYDHNDPIGSAPILVWGLIWAGAWAALIVAAVLWHAVR